MNKRFQKKYDKYARFLGITKEVEKFVLNHILLRDGIDLILVGIQEIRLLDNGFVKVRCRTILYAYDFSVFGYNGEDLTRKQEQEISAELHHKITG